MSTRKIALANQIIFFITRLNLLGGFSDPMQDDAIVSSWKMCPNSWSAYKGTNGTFSDQLPKALLLYGRETNDSSIWEEMPEDS